MYNCGINKYHGFISVMDIMSALKDIGRTDQAYKYCRCNMCGYSRPDIVTLDSYKMYYVHAPIPEFSTMDEKEKEFIRLYGGYPEQPIHLCENCIKDLIQMFYSEFSEKDDLTEYETEYSREQRINAFMKWFSENYWEIAYKANSHGDIMDSNQEQDTREFLSRFFDSSDKSAKDIENSK